jgi:hypothetical protein
MFNNRYTLPSGSPNQVVHAAELRRPHQLEPSIQLQQELHRILPDGVSAASMQTLSCVPFDESCKPCEDLENEASTFGVAMVKYRCAEGYITQTVRPRNTAASGHAAGCLADV